MDEIEKLLSSVAVGNDEMSELRKMVDSGQITMPQIKEQIEKAGERQCPYCLISEGRIEAKKIKETVSFISALEIRPANLGHVIVFPRKHIEGVHLLSREEAAELFCLVREILKAMLKIFPGANIVVNSGYVAGQAIAHLVVNIIPRSKDDGVSLFWKAREANESGLEDVRKKIMENLPKTEEKRVESVRKFSRTELPGDRWV